MSIMDERITNPLTKDLYPILARKYHTTDTSVERHMRHAIETAWESNHIKYKQLYFGKEFLRSNAGKKLTNGVFINIIS